jgi:hypothetical protein
MPHERVLSLHRLQGCKRANAGMRFLKQRADGSSAGMPSAESRLPKLSPIAASLPCPDEVIRSVHYVQWAVAVEGFENQCEAIVPSARLAWHESRHRRLLVRFRKSGLSRVREGLPCVHFDLFRRHQRSQVIRQICCLLLKPVDIVGPDRATCFDRQVGRLLQPSVGFL